MTDDHPNLLDVAAHTRPLELLRTWLDDARLRSRMENWNVLHLATADAAGVPSVRPVLMKNYDPKSGRLRFFTNILSRKGRDIAQRARVAGLFHWDALHRQVRLEGDAAPSAPEVSDAYFATRDRESQLGAWASRQSEPLKDPADLLTRVVERGFEFAGRAVPRPPFWGGFDIDLQVIEFWQGQPARLHDRIRFTRSAGADTWDWVALNP